MDIIVIKGMHDMDLILHPVFSQPLPYQTDMIFLMGLYVITKDCNIRPNFLALS